MLRPLIYAGSAAGLLLAVSCAPDVPSAPRTVGSDATDDAPASHLPPAPRVVISELMYNPPNDLESLEYVELANASETDVDLSGWALSKGVRYTFGPGVHLDPGERLVVCRDRAAFTRGYPDAPLALGPWEGALADKGERVTLANAGGDRVDSVKYADRAPWPVGADGYGSSLERISLLGPSDEPGNWAPSAPPETERIPTGTPGAENDNEAPALPPLVKRVAWEPRSPRPEEPITVRAELAGPPPDAAVTLLFRVAAPELERGEHRLAMEHVPGTASPTVYEGVIPGQRDGRVVRFRLRVSDPGGALRYVPSPHELRPTFSLLARAPSAPTTIPQGLVFRVGARREAAPEPSWRGGRRGRRGGWRGGWSRGGPEGPLPGRGDAVFVLVAPDGERADVYDHIQVTSRKGGYKVRFHKDRPLALESTADDRAVSIRTANIIFESSSTFVLSEWLAYEVYRRTSVPTPFSDHIRLSIDGRTLGYHLLVEQPNGSFLERHGRAREGNLYKILWYEHGVVGQHEKKTNTREGHDDIVSIVRALESGDAADQWDLIEASFNVPEVIDYFAASMCISNWDGFFNNYFTYRDTGADAKWEMYPWDEDKTWGYYDGRAPGEVLHDMPLTFGMNGTYRSRSRRGRSRFGGGSWWRDPGWFSGPLLANPEFRSRFLARLRDLVEDVFTEETFLPIIDELERRLRPEVALRAELQGWDRRRALADLAEDIRSYRELLRLRRRYILTDDELRRRTARSD